RIDCGPEEVARCVAEAGIGFCFAPRFHPAMRHAGPPRRGLGIATAFNFLGPLANPAAVRRLMIGVADPSMSERMVGVLAARGSERVLVVPGDDGLDELTVSTTSTVVELRDGEVRDYPVDPKELGIAPAPTEALVGGEADTNAAAAPPPATPRPCGPPPPPGRLWWVAMPPPTPSSPAASSPAMPVPTVTSSASTPLRACSLPAWSTTSQA